MNPVFHYRQLNPRLDWKAHEASKPITAQTCIDLLKTELAKRPKWPMMSSGTPMFYGTAVTQ